jgi:hypothetical protein
LILFSPEYTTPLYKVPAGGGQPVQVTRLKQPGESSHRFPFFLPDNRHFLFFAAGQAGSEGIFVGSLDSNETHRLIEADSAGMFLPPHYLLFVRGQTLLAQQLNLETWDVVGDPVVIADSISGVARPQGTHAEAAFSTSVSGVVAYRNLTANQRQLTWFDRSGRRMEALGEPDAAEPTALRISPVGAALLYSDIQFVTLISG